MTGAAVFLFILLGIVIYVIYNVRSRQKEALEKHNAKMQDLAQAIAKEAEDASIELDECDLYLRMFLVYAEQHVNTTGRLISSNRLSEIERNFREGYQSLIGKGLPPLESPYRQIKTLLREHDLMVKSHS